MFFAVMCGMPYFVRTTFGLDRLRGIGRVRGEHRCHDREQRRGGSPRPFLIRRKL